MRSPTTRARREREPGTPHYRCGISDAISLSGARNLPFASFGSAILVMASSFSSGSARRYICVVLMSPGTTGRSTFVRRSSWSFRRSYRSLANRGNLHSTRPLAALNGEARVTRRDAALASEIGAAPGDVVQVRTCFRSAWLPGDRAQPAGSAHNPRRSPGPSE